MPVELQLLVSHENLFIQVIQGLGNTHLQALYLSFTSRNRLIITLLRKCAAKTQYLSIATHEAVIIDTFAADIAGYALPLVSGHFVRSNRHAHPLFGEQVAVAHLTIGTHLLLVLVFDFRIHLLCQRLRGFFSADTDSAA